MSLVIGYNAAGITKQTKVDIERVFGKSNVATITYDNGVEFSSWRATEKTLDVDIYFADPYKSGQRGRNENFNGLIRDFYPKGTDFKKLTAQCILDLDTINLIKWLTKQTCVTPRQYLEHAKIVWCRA